MGMLLEIVGKLYFRYYIKMFGILRVFKWLISL